MSRRDCKIDLKARSLFTVLEIVMRVTLAARMRYENRIQSKDCCIFILAVSLLLSELGRAVCPSKRVEL